MNDLNLECPAYESKRQVTRGTVRPLTPAMMHIAAHPSNEWQRALRSRFEQMGEFNRKTRREANEASLARLAAMESQAKGDNT